MQKQNDTIHLLILDPSQNDAQSLISLLRNAGHATRTHRITSEEDLEEVLKTSNWDLLLARDVEQEFTADSALAMLRRMDKDIPCLFLTNEDNPERTVTVMKAGAQGAVSFGDNDLLLLKIRRELEALEDRRRRRTLESHLHEAEQRCQLLLESSKDAIAYINDGMHIYANQSYMEFLGYDDIDDLTSTPVLDTLTGSSQEDYKTFMKAFADHGRDGMTLNCTARRSDDHELAVTMSVSAATYDGEACTQIVLQPEHSDTELEEKLREIRSQDLLTGLYNRQYLMQELERVIATAGKHSETGALAYIAIDNFAAMKARVGISGADLLLGDLANLLKREAGEDLMLARMSDDAFCFLCLPCDEKSLTRRCEQVCKAVEEHLFDINGRTVPLTVSVGIASITENSPKAEDLLARAHIASSEVRSHEGKAQGNGIHVYNPAEHEAMDDSNSAEVIMKALEDDRFRLLFQPVINLRGGDEEHYEVYVRMLSENGKETSPYDILPPAGPSATAIKIDRWVFAQAIKRLAEHRGDEGNTRIFLSVTAETLQDETFTPWLSSTLKAARLPGDALVFQIREGDAHMHMKQAKEFTSALHELHCRVSIGQFGSTLDPFSTLKHIDTDFVKIDSSFTEEIQKSDEAREQLNEIVKSLQNAGKLTIMPMVESASVLATLWQAGVNYIQGYYLQAPAPEMGYDFGDS
ncbi:EAL domain-containing protein [Marinobacter adhaerens]|uniref:EAL domain-containing protein n=1 Tax=Marinobacter adhaerens TaxID=1033846 RepID=A0A851HRA4_9GAMM|nr:EAL domain-containing protein [Marinobacter adhaerens]NWN91260.1 EAL domain-containing protein [Marinobacter adhaerens]